MSRPKRGQRPMRAGAFRGVRRPVPNLEREGASPVNANRPPLHERGPIREGFPSVGPSSGWGYQSGAAQGLMSRAKARSSGVQPSLIWSL